MVCLRSKLAPTAEAAEKDDTNATDPMQGLQVTSGPNIAHANQPVFVASEWGKTHIRMSNGDVKKFQDVYITPSSVQEWNFKEFGYDHFGQGGPKTSHQHGDTSKGIMPYSVQGLLALERTLVRTNICVIVSKGMTDSLGVNDRTVSLLDQMKTSGAIGEFHILTSKEVPAKHNERVQAGKQVFTEFHSTC